MTFSPRYTLGATDLTDHPFAVYWGSDYGSPENVSEVIDSLLADGDVEISRRAGNRSMAFSVLIEEADTKALADAEEVLALECDQDQNTFAIDPGDGIGATTVFEIFKVQARFVHDDDMEWQGFRRYDLTWRALPFGRSESETVVEALTVGAGSEATISDGTSAAGWSSPDGTVTVSSGKLLIPQHATPESSEATDVGTIGVYVTEATLTTAAIDFSATPYLSFEYEGATTFSAVRAVYADGVELVRVADVNLTAPRKRATYYCQDASVTSLRFVFAKSLLVGTDADVLVDNVKRAPRSPKASTSGRESLRVLSIGGSARTQASLKVGHASAGLGDVVLFTHPALGSGYSPDIRQFGVSLTTAANAATVSGYDTVSLASTRTFDIPAASLPSGGFSLWGLLKASGTGISRAIDWTATTRIGSTDLPGGLSGRTAPITVDATPRLTPIAGMTLPPSDVGADSSAVVRITLTQVSGVGDNIEFDQLWLFAAGEDSALTIIEAGAGTPALGSVHNYAWVDSPSLARLAPSVWVGTSATKTDVLHAGAFARRAGLHLMPAGDVGVFLVTTSATNAELSGRYYKRHHTHAVD